MAQVGDSALEGLTGARAAAALKKRGANSLAQEKPSWLKKVARWVASPMSLLLLTAALLSFYLGKNFDGFFILALFIVNFVIAERQEAKADQAIAKLQRKLAVKVDVRRDGQWQEAPSENIVPDDVIRLEVGQVVPADIDIKDCANLQINESALTGESLPLDKNVGDNGYTGSFVTTGSLTAVVTATGTRTKFGKTLTMGDEQPKQSALDKDILTITRFLTVVSLLAAFIITIVLLFFKHQSLGDLLTLDLSILIAGTPVAMPTVMSLIISLGVVRLSRKHVIVRRLSALEDLANVDMLLSDKTGTLTKNKIIVENVIGYGKDEDTVLKWARSAAGDDDGNTINQAIIEQAKKDGVKAYAQKDYTPADSKRKRSTALVRVGDHDYTISMGAPQIVRTLCKIDAKTKAKFQKDVKDAANHGYRSLAVAIGKGQAEKQLQLIGLLLLSDELRDDAPAVIKFLQQNGIDVKMNTGDNHAIAARVAEQLGLKGHVMAAAGKTSELTVAQVRGTSVFAEVLPDDKFRIVKKAARHHTVAATGDGVNDLPALKEASVGIAVRNAVDALKGSADIVLMTEGIGVIRRAITEARQIFVRTYYYSVFRIAESFQLVLSIAILSIIYGSFPVTPIQIILLALLNDLPIITLAYDRVSAGAKPSVIHVKERFILASLYGIVGIAESLVLFWLVKDVLQLPVPEIQTMFFLNFAVFADLLIYVVHTKKHWWKWLPAKPVIYATLSAIAVATILALSGLLFQRISGLDVLLVWGWAIVWMQIAALVKRFFQHHFSA
jgi:H+-transporting ATPase